MSINIKIRPEHPGGFIKDWILPDDITITHAAKLLGVSRQSLDALINMRRALSPEMAMKIEAVFGGTASAMLNMQSDYDLYQAKKHQDSIIGSLSPYKTHPSQRVHV